MIRLTDDRAFVDGFLDVTSISDQKINFIFKEYALEISGKDLVVAAFSRSELILLGRLEQVALHYFNET